MGRLHLMGELVLFNLEVDLFHGYRWTSKDSGSNGGGFCSSLKESMRLCVMDRRAFGQLEMYLLLKGARRWRRLLFGWPGRWR